ncbi:uncharacterized protein LOC125021552 [Mugil cephalus]|uniref:uncharacterized protein LOC125021552 n=1 Tax=Mugil cephalus TaxID=48193 RepID=UPI001FB6F5AD|nr:uncharacterized protein LOC125021552 [Mugil cephalus]
MTHPMFAFYVACLLLGTLDLLTTQELSSSLQFHSVDIGRDVTLECLYEDNVAVMLYWYRQTLGQKPQWLSKFYKHEQSGTFNDEFEDNPRFKLETGHGKNHLKILNVQTSDSAIYYCISAFSYSYTFLEGYVIDVKGSGLNIRTSVHQLSNETVEPGVSLSLNCTIHTEPGTCDEEYSVHWFKSSEESFPTMIYTHGGRNDEYCESNLTIQSHTCRYNLPIKSLNRSHDGTYYCAVSLCGHILFGNGTRVDVNDEVGSRVLLYVLSGALAFTTILLLFLAYMACTLHKRKNCKCTGRSSAASTQNTGHQDADSLHYAALRETRVARPRSQRDNTMTECAYSAVRK